MNLFKRTVVVIFLLLMTYSNVFSVKNISIVIVGFGSVGKILAGRILEQKEYMKNNLHVELKICGLFKSSDAIFCRDGLAAEMVSGYIAGKIPGVRFEKIIEAELGLISSIDGPFILVDTTASSETLQLQLETLRRGGYVVTANKKILAGPLEDFEKINFVSEGRLFYSTTVGAGLPIISMLKKCILANDEILEIKGVLSGTLGFVFSKMDNGVSFSQAVSEASKNGFTEPHPKDDLSGFDVARKLIILARTIGQVINFSEVEIRSLYPSPEIEATLVTLDKQTYLEELKKIDDYYNAKVGEAHSQDKVLRYIASISKTIEGHYKLAVGIEAVDRTSPLFYLTGTENMVAFKTKAYYSRPLVIQGPGAGVEITAVNIFADICEILNSVKENERSL